MWWNSGAHILFQLLCKVGSSCEACMAWLMVLVFSWYLCFSAWVPFPHVPFFIHRQWIAHRCKTKGIPHNVGTIPLETHVGRMAVSWGEIHVRNTWAKLPAFPRYLPNYYKQAVGNACVNRKQWDGQWETQVLCCWEWWVCGQMDWPHVAMPTKLPFHLVQVAMHTHVLGR